MPLCSSISRPAIDVRCQHHKRHTGPLDGIEVESFQASEDEFERARTYAAGRHNFGYWSRCLPAACDFLAGALTPV